VKPRRKVVDGTYVQSELPLLAIDARRLGFDYAVGILARGHVRVGVVEGVQRTGWRDLEVKGRAGCQVAYGKLDPLALGMPEEENLVGPAQPLG